MTEEEAIAALDRALKSQRPPPPLKTRAAGGKIVNPSTPIKPSGPVDSKAVKKIITPLDIREAKFVEQISNGADATQAAMKVLDSPTRKSAQYLGRTFLRRPNVQAALAKLLKKHQMGVERLVTEVDKGLKEGKIGGHVEYVDRQMKLAEMAGDIVPIPKESEKSPPGVHDVMLINRLIVEAEQRGLSLDP